MKTNYLELESNIFYCLVTLISQKNWIGAIFGENTGVLLNPPKIFTTEDRKEIGGQKFNKVETIWFPSSILAHDSNKGFPNGLGFRYGNFFIPRVEKTSKN